MKDMIDMYQLQKKQITVKINMGGLEWTGLRSLPITYLKYIDQLVITFNLNDNFAYHEGNINILKGLKNEFKTVNIHMNNKDCWPEGDGQIPSKTFEVSLVNKRLLKLNSNVQSFRQLSLNKKTTASEPDCQIP